MFGIFFALLFAAKLEAGNTVGNRSLTWPTREIPFTICESEIEGLGAVAREIQLLQRGCLFERRLSRNMATRIRIAMTAWRAHFEHNVVFVERPIRGDANNIVVFTAEEDGDDADDCYTLGVGFARVRDSQYVRLGANCMVDVIMHEMLHVVGVHHEQQRTDRGDYLQIIPLTPSSDRVVRAEQLRWQHQYDTEGTCRSDYDFRSLMHYRIEDLPATYPRIQVRDAGRDRLRVQQVTAREVGRRGQLSDGDIATVELLYPRRTLTAAERAAPLCPTTIGFQRRPVRR